MRTRTLTLALAAAAGLVGLSANYNLSSARKSSLITQAGAEIGRPVTPGSVAGVARRTERRVIRRDAIVGGTVVDADANYEAGPTYDYGAYASSPGAYDSGYSGVWAGYGPGPVPGSVIVNPATGRWCTFGPSGWHWCWTP
jgi:hypothetical protein